MQQWTPAHRGVFLNHYADVMAKAFIACEMHTALAQPLPRQASLAVYGTTLADGSVSWRPASDACSAS